MVVWLQATQLVCVSSLFSQLLFCIPKAGLHMRFLVCFLSPLFNAMFVAPEFAMKIASVN